MMGSVCSPHDMWRKDSSWSQETWVLGLALPFPPSETLGLSSPLSGPQFPHLDNGATVVDP